MQYRQRYRAVPGRTGRRLGVRASFGLVSLAGCAIVLGGCWPFNRTPPQQEYFDALKMGNSAQASQLWLQMSPEQRAKFGRGEGIRPSVSHDDVQQAIEDHYANPDEDGSAPSRVQVTPDLGGGLQNLPSYLKPSGAGGEPQTAPADQ